MDKFRYSIDVGSGYALVDVYENKLILEVSRSAESYIVKKQILTYKNWKKELAKNKLVEGKIKK